MTESVRRVRAAITAAVIAVVAIAAVALGIVFSSGLGFADAAGQPLDVPAVSITPSPVPSADPSPTATPSPTPTAGDDSPEVVTPPPPVTVELDDHGGLRNDGSTDDTSVDNSGHGNSNG